MNDLKKSDIGIACESLVRSLFGNCYKEDGNLHDTPERISRMYREMILPKTEINKIVETQFTKTFPSKSNSVIVAPGIKAFSVCPHHLLPVEYDIVIGYQPDLRVVGASKLARVAIATAKQAILQEDYVLELSNYITEYLECSGHGIVVIGYHGCMRCRGIKTQGSFCVSELSGSFKDNSKIRDEFYKLIEISGGMK